MNVTTAQRNAILAGIAAGILALIITLLAEGTSVIEFLALCHIHIFWALMIIGVPDPAFRYFFMAGIVIQWLRP